MVSEGGKGAVELKVVDEAEETPLPTTCKSFREGESCVMLEVYARELGRIYSSVGVVVVAKRGNSDPDAIITK